MTALLQKMARRRTAYLPAGLLVVALAAAAFVLGAGGRRLVEHGPHDGAFAYGISTGGLLVLGMLWQWRLYFARRRRDGPRIQREYKLHRWVGILPAIVLILHMGKPGASLLSLISWALLISSLAGLFNQEIIRIGAGRRKTFWLAVHVGLAAFILPLVLIHVWAVFAFRVN